MEANRLIRFPRCAHLPSSVPILANGQPHNITLDVASAESDHQINQNWYLSGLLQVNLDSSTLPTTGNITLLSASYQLYRHVERDETVVRTVGYSLPVALHWHVLTVAPTTSFVSPRTQWQTPRNRSDRAVKATPGEPATTLLSRAKVNDVTPSFLRWLYESETYTPNTRGENVLGIVGLLGDYPTDLTVFMQKYRSEIDDATFTVVGVNGGGYDPTHPNEEANMDIQYAEAIVYPTPHIFYSASRSDTDNDFAIWLEYILDQENIPQNSSAYRTAMKNIPSRGNMQPMCVNSSRGSLETCLREDGTVRFGPTFPGTCPYVTVVGATTDYEPEVGADLSGGGFSDYFERPWYQEEAVSTLLQHLGNQYQGLYNASGRGIPDIAAEAMGLPIFFNGDEQKESGTSLAAPVVAGIISLLDDWLISTGQRPLGFLNPWLYGRASGVSTTSQWARIRVATWMDSLPSLDGTLCVPLELILLHCRRWSL
ncbi:subtilisin-like protein [Lactarius sanguifluus]|nr:subtilisin-like protein [Lactarius sanguifluus]